MATRIHSRYQRRLRDLPTSGYEVTLLVEVRRFFCLNEACSHKTFAESFFPLAHRSAQCTDRLQTALQRLGIMVGGEAGARLGKQLGLRTSPASLLRLARHIELPPPHPLKAIGLDDWAYKRRLRYGTLICDLETGRPIELLPDRSIPTVRDWLQQHPHIQIVSRDRGGEYATAVQQGAPQALQVADRWHVLQNLVDRATAFLVRIHNEIASTSSPRARSSLSQANQQREDRYARLLRLQEQDQPIGQIAAQVGLSERTAYRWLAQGIPPSGSHSMRSASVIDAYRAYLRKRWQQGCRKGSTLYRELKEQGYQGSQRAVYRYVHALQGYQDLEGEERWQNAFSAKQGTWLLLKQPSDLNEREQAGLTLLKRSHASILVAYELIQRFENLLRQRQGEQLGEWMQAVEESHIPELQAFTAGIERDKSAVQAGLTLPYSNGLLEGHVNRLKLIKRSMYGRAKFDLLRKRVLYAS